MTFGSFPFFNSVEVIAFSIVNEPTCVRLNSVKCPPTSKVFPRSRAIALIYVPAEQVTSISTSTKSSARLIFNIFWLDI